MTTPRIIPCLTRECERYRGLLGPPDDPVFICEAFPTGIPEDILNGKDEHAKPRVGDHGFTFKRRKEE